ncbi:hypothetical protein [Streptomyces sp. NPDC056682]|uniref:hypothetical protein n=1 Tax=Streptomyces sp. NPDC056682 TaxID=3345909 RepID=UPI0036B40FC7
MGAQRTRRVRRIGEWLAGAAVPEARTLSDALGLADNSPDLQRLWRWQPQQLDRIEQLYAAAQRAFERRTRDDVCRTLEQAVRGGVRMASVEHAETRAAAAERLKDEADAAARRLDADAALASGRGLNTGLAFGMVLSPVVLAFAVGEAVPALFHAKLACPEQLSLMHALVCFAGGALGAVFSVIVRLRNAYQLMRRAPGRGGVQNIPPDPRQLAQIMRQEGWYRVVVGWFLATSLFLLINGGVLTIFAPPATPAGLCAAGPLSLAAHEALIKAFFFWGTIGFLAGLNERWAYGLLRRGGGDRHTGDAAS